MRAYLFTAALLLVSCDTDPEPRPPPSTRLVYPSGLAFWRPEGGPSTNGYLYVANANFDRCYDSGSVVALDLDALGVRPFGAPFTEPALPSDQVPSIEDLRVSPASYVRIQSFAGEMGLWAPTGRSPRLFVASRAEANVLHSIDVGADGTSLTCVDGGGTDCRDKGLSLVDVPGSVGGFPSAPGPQGITVDRANPDASVWVTHSEIVGPAESGDENEFQSYLVNVPASNPTRDVLGIDNFVPLGTNGQTAGAAHSTAIGSRYTYASGRNTSSKQLGARPARFILRLVDRQVPGVVLDTQLGTDRDYSVREARGVAVLTSAVRTVANPADPAAPFTVVDERVYLLARGPDTLLILDVVNAGGTAPGAGDVPSVRIVSALPLPEGASELEVIPRGAGRGNLVAITGSGDEAVSIFDEEVGQLIAQVQVGEQDPNQPSQPFGLAADVRGNAARLFASTFGDGRVAVIDIPDLDRPQNARLVVRLGAQQLRDPRQGTSVCQENSP
ncbi:YncE family protein [Pyxidicoccus sp. 3LG]